MLYIVADSLSQNDVPFLHVKNNSKDFSKGGPVLEFKTSPTKRLLLLQLDNGAQGLDLICANHVYLLEPICNPSLEAQAVNRCHRIGQERQVYVHKLVVEGTVEERILQTQERTSGGHRAADLPAPGPGSPGKRRAGKRDTQMGGSKSADQSNLTFDDLTFCLRGEVDQSLRDD